MSLEQSHRTLVRNPQKKPRPKSGLFEIQWCLAKVSSGLVHVVVAAGSGFRVVIFWLLGDQCIARKQ